MPHVVKKPFHCSFDGVNSEPLSIGDIRDFGSMAAGLVKAGYLEPTPVEFPAQDAPPGEPRSVVPTAQGDADVAPPPPTAAGDPPPNTVEIPDDWRDLSGNKLRAIAAQVSPLPIRSKADAVTAIEAELARRTQGKTEESVHGD